MHWVNWLISIHSHPEQVSIHPFDLSESFLQHLPCAVTLLMSMDLVSGALDTHYIEIKSKTRQVLRGWFRRVASTHPHH